MKVLINECHGAFALSRKGYDRLIELGIPVRNTSEAYGEDDGFVIYDQSLTPGMVVSDNPDDAEHASMWVHADYRYYSTCLEYSSTYRSHPTLIQMFEELGQDAADPTFCRLKIVEIPDDVKFDIAENFGAESVVETHRRWN